MTSPTPTPALPGQPTPKDLRNNPANPAAVQQNGAPAPNANGQPAAPSAGAQQAKELLTLNRTNGDGFAPQPGNFGAPAQPLAPSSPDAKAPEVKPLDGKTPAIKTPDAKTPTTPQPTTGLNGQPNAKPVGTPQQGVNGNTNVSTNGTNAQPELVRRLLGDSNGSSNTNNNSKTVTRTVIGPNGAPMQVTERKLETPKPIAAAIPSTYTYYFRQGDTSRRSETAGSSGSDASSSGSSKASSSSDTSGSDSKVTVSNEEALKIQGEISSESGSDLSKGSVLSYANHLEDQIADLQRASGSMSEDDFESAKSDLKEKLNLAQSLYTRIKGTELRILQEDPAESDPLPVSLMGPSLFGSSDASGGGSLLG